MERRRWRMATPPTPKPTPLIRSLQLLQVSPTFQLYLMSSIIVTHPGITIADFKTVWDATSLPLKTNTTLNQATSTRQSGDSNGCNGSRRSTPPPWTATSTLTTTTRILPWLETHFELSVSFFFFYFFFFWLIFFHLEPLLLQRTATKHRHHHAPPSPLLLPIHLDTVKWWWQQQQ